MKSTLLAICVFLSTFCSLWSQVILPYSENFEGLSLGNLNGQNGWVSESTVEVVNDSVIAHEGSNYLKIPGGNPFYLAQLSILDSTPSEPVYLDFFVRPVAAIDDLNTALEFVESFSSTRTRALNPSENLKSIFPVPASTSGEISRSYALQ